MKKKRKRDMLLLKNEKDVSIACIWVIQVGSGPPEAELLEMSRGPATKCGWLTIILGSPHKANCWKFKGGLPKNVVGSP
jgi:hypothetical protein